MAFESRLLHDLVLAAQTASIANMLYITTLLSSVMALQAAVASPIQVRSPYAVKETHYAPRKWHKKARASGSGTILLQIGLKQGQFDELERHLYEGTSNSPTLLSWSCF
jgi:hypothetical protein